MADNIIRIQRWLNRLRTACDQHEWHRAVSEADCLSAEVRHVRDELWEKVVDQAEQHKVAAYHSYGFNSWIPKLIASAKIVGIALIVVCCTTLPISTEQVPHSTVASVPTGAEKNKEEFALVTTEEKELLEMLRDSMRQSNISIASAQNETETPAVAAAKKKKESNKIKKTAVTKQTIKPVAQTAKNKTEESLQPDELLTLVGIGQKSLFGNQPAIKIVDRAEKES